MAIAEFSKGPARRLIGFVRTQASDEANTILAQRGYNCYLIEDGADPSPGQLSATDSLVVFQRTGKPSHFKVDLNRVAGFLNHDCRIYILYAPDPDSQAIAVDEVGRLQLPPSGIDQIDVGKFSGDWFDHKTPQVFGPFVHLLPADASCWMSLADLIAWNPAASPPSASLDIRIHTVSGEASGLDEERRLLFKRAFSDCSSIELFPKTNGLSGVAVFEAFAHQSKNIVGSPAPYRCLIKVGPRTKVVREFQKYRETALGNIPFHLGPRLRESRCVLGRSQGLITGDFVTGAETLRDCARDGRGAHAISNLFNHTLIAWRRGATLEKLSLRDIILDHLKDRCTVPGHRVELVRRHGAVKSIDELMELTRVVESKQPILIGVVHGDLHATNVLVRMSDAVIIDLESIEKSKPLLLDAASLEAGLLVDGFIGDHRSAANLLASLRQPLYTIEALAHDDHHCDPWDRSAWFVESVRQIRMQARQMEARPYQYAWILAAVLLKKACNPDVLPNNEFVATSGVVRLSRESIRAMAYVLAEEIIVQLVDKATVAADEEPSR